VRNEARKLSLKGATLNVAGVDDPWRGHADFDRALSMSASQCPTIMLCHQPDLFPAGTTEIDLTWPGTITGDRSNCDSSAWQCRQHTSSPSSSRALRPGPSAVICQPRH